MPYSPKPIVLIILDGWGYREATQHNAIAAAHKPHWDNLWQRCPHTLLEGSGLAVGLPVQQMGNSEVGHMTIGAGRIVHQDLTRIDQAIDSGEFFNHAVLLTALQQASWHRKSIHILGLLSPGGVHSHERHIHALIQLAAQQRLEKIYIHAFLDGRDCPPQNAQASLTILEDLLQRLGRGQIASLIGRYYAMDRDQRWGRIQSAYDLLTQGKAAYHATTAMEGLALAYARGETDEFVAATAIHPATQGAVVIEDGDSIFLMNYRADRIRQLTYALIDPSFTGFQAAVRPQLAACVSLTQYAYDINTSVAFPPQWLRNTLAEVIAQRDLTQLRLAETEKYAHVTFFFNGGVEQPFPGEDRVLIPSQSVSTYNLAPKMRALELTRCLIEAICAQKHDVIVCNFANPDMVGHTGDFAATVRAIEMIDDCLGQIIMALHQVGGEAIITADHGNAECLYDDTIQQPHTAHTCEPVPFLYVGRPATITKITGNLADIAPTLLYLMNLDKPVEMIGNSLVQLQ